MDARMRQFIHDVRNPLNAALGISTMLASDASLSPLQQKKLRVLKSSVEDLHRIFENMFNNSQLQGGFEEKSPQVSEKQKTILLVEDYPPNAMIMTEQLHQLGYRHDLAVTGQEALDKYSSQVYDVILMDIQLPDINGIDVTRRIRAIEKSKNLTPVSIIAISGMPEEKEDFLRIGMTDCLTKPIGLGQLKEKLALYCD
jgi:CheY-like chemotaxis protein